MKRQLYSWVRKQRWAETAAYLFSWRDWRKASRIASDLLQTKAEAAFARALPQPLADAPTLLILSLTDSVYAAKTDCMQALAFLRRGWRVRVLTSNLYVNARNVYRAYGIKDFLPFESLTTSPEVEKAAALEVERRSREPMDFQSVLQWSYRNAWVGPQLLAAVSRKHFDGAPDPQEPAVRQDVLRNLGLSVQFVHAAEAYFSSSRTDLILVNEPNYHALGPFVDIAILRNIPIIHYTQPSRDDALIQKKLNAATRRLHSNSVTPQTLERLLQQPWGPKEEAQLDAELASRYGGVWKTQSRNQPGTEDFSADAIRNQLSLDPSKPTAVLFSHVLWDANLFYGRDLFENYGDWFIETVKAAVANPGVNWIIKLHPANIWKRAISGAVGEYGELKLIREQVGELPDHVKLLPADTRISTLSLFKFVDFGITVRGSIGYELPCFGVPVVTAGTGRFSGFGFTLDHETRGSYLDMLARLQTVPRLDAQQVHKARVHAHALLVRRPWVFSSFSTQIGDDVMDPLMQNLRPTVHSWQEIDDLGDLDRFADWAVSEDVDYLAPQQGAMST